MTKQMLESILNQVNIKNINWLLENNDDLSCKFLIDKIGKFECKIDIEYGTIYLTIKQAHKEIEQTRFKWDRQVPNDIVVFKDFIGFLVDIFNSKTTSFDRLIRNIPENIDDLYPQKISLIHDINEILCVKYRLFDIIGFDRIKNVNNIPYQEYNYMVSNFDIYHYTTSTEEGNFKIWEFSNGDKTIIIKHKKNDYRHFVIVTETIIEQNRTKEETIIIPKDRDLALNTFHERTTCVIKPLFFRNLDDYMGR